MTALYQNTYTRMVTALICLPTALILIGIPSHLSHAASCISKTDVFSATSNGQWRYSSGGLATYQNLNAEPGKTVNDLAFGDFDGDGKTDVFSVTSSGQWRYSSGGLVAYQNLNAEPGKTVNDLAFGDFDGLSCVVYAPLITR